MPEPIYSIKLFYGDMKFTNDYSNVLQFNNKTARDNYFDSMDNTVEFENIEYNTILFDGGAVKLAIPNENLDVLDNFNYCYINFALVGNGNFVQKRKYYFITAYETISSNENVTVIRFILQYDIWQNNQFDFSFKESNIERMHVDRWGSQGELLYKRPVLDAIDSNMYVKTRNRMDDSSYANITIDSPSVFKEVLWVMVTASHTLSNKPDQLVYHFFPVIFKKDDRNTISLNPKDAIFYYQNGIKMATYGGKNIYFPSLECLDNAYLRYACGNDSNDDVVNIINVQIFNWLPLEARIEYHDGDARIVVGMRRGVNFYALELYAGTPNILTDSFMLATYGTGDLSLFIRMNIDKTINISYSKPIKPANGDDYSYSHEPALFMSPIMKRYMGVEDTSAFIEIPDIKFLDYMYSTSSNTFAIIERIGFSATSAYTYFEFSDSYRLSDSVEGFAFIKPSYMCDILNDAWVDYCVTQRDSDRMMMWTNIATGGLSELGSTAVSAGIGYRSNMERAKALENSLAADQSLANYSVGGMQEARISRNVVVNGENATMFKNMAKNAMYMSGIGGVTAFSSNAIHQAMAQRAKEKSVMNTPSSLAKAGNAISSIINFENYNYYIETIVDDESFERYKIIFNKYGYYIGGTDLPNINSRKYFNYIKTNGAVLTGSCNQLILASLANIFDTGVTIWHMDYTTYATLYDYTKENIERGLM